MHDYWRKITNTYPELNGVRIHDLRHTYATERVGLISIEELRSLMGHESIQTTLRYQKVTSLRDATRTQKAESAARHALNILINPDS